MKILVLFASLCASNLVIGLVLYYIVESEGSKTLAGGRPGFDMVGGLLAACRDSIYLVNRWKT